MMKLKKHTAEGFSYFQRQPLSDKLYQYIKRQIEWPDILRWKGSVFLNSLVHVISMTTISCLVCLFNFNFNVNITVPLSVLNTVSVALGLLLAFRVNTAYDRYWEGRKLIQVIIATIRSFTRQIWTHAPEETTEDLSSKKGCVKFLLAFFLATIHHLRQEKGVHYKDLKGLLPPDWKPACVQRTNHDDTTSTKKSSTNLDSNQYPSGGNTSQRGGSNGSSLDEQEECPLHYTNGKPSKMPKKRSEETCHVLNESDNPTDLINVRKSLITQEFHIPNLSELNVEELEKFVKDLEHCVNLRDEEEAQLERQPLLNNHTSHKLDLPAYTHLSHKKRKFLYQEALKLVKKYETQKRQAEMRRQDFSEFTCSEDLPYLGDSEICLPIEILFQVTYYVKRLKAEDKNKSALLSSATSLTDTLVNSLTALERIVQTPIPRAYNIHLKQAVTLYIFFLPLALVESLGWLVTPIVALASFTLFGILAIGEEIENPFGYDDNDLPVLDYYEGLKKDVDYILHRIPQTNTLVYGI
ncbi:unnamed protein product [Rhizopus stolonifer]